MASSLTTRLRHNVQFPLRYAMDSMRVRLRVKASGITRILIASDGVAFTSEEQFAPLFANRRRIADKLGVVFDRRSIDDVLASGSAFEKYSAVFAKLSFLAPKEEALEKIARLR